MVQAQIGYRFKNPDLIIQAFTRRSYAEENGGKDNEVLEFIGDKALDLAAVKLLTDRYGNTQGSFSSELDEDELTRLKSRMVRKSTLAGRIDEMGFADHLLMGKGDIMNGVSDEPSVKEDLFESLLGAVVIDCGYDFPTICSVVEAMLVPEDFFLDDEDDNYVRMIQDWEEQVNGVIPLYMFKEAPYESSWYYPFSGISQSYPINASLPHIKYHCILHLTDGLPDYRGYGESKSEARMNVCRLAYDDLKEKGIIKEQTIRDEIDDPSRDDSISQLEILARRGYFSIPEYFFSQTHDQNGNPVWTAECSIKEYGERFSGTSSSKKDAKKDAAFGMLRFVLEREDG